jgi:diguanylate cyclase (GGDEF)-like protein
MTISPNTTTLPITKAARRLGVHPNTLRAWADHGRIDCLRVNRRGDRRFLVTDLDAFVSAAQSAPPPRADVSAAAQPTSGLSAGRRRPAEPGRSTSVDHAAPIADFEAQIDSIAKLGTRLNHLSSVDEIGQAICSELHQLIDYHNVRVYRVRGDDVLPVAWQGQVSEYIDEDGRQLRVRLGEGITGWVARFGVAQYLPNAAVDPRGQLMPGTEAGLAESMLVAPMLYQDRAIGVIVLSKLGLDQFAPHDLRYLCIYASIAAQAMVNADISARLRAQEETLDQQLHGQRELLRVTEAILTNLDPAAVIAEVADSLGRIINVDTLGVYVHQVQQRTLSPLLARGVGADAFLSRRLPDNGSVVSEVLKRGEARSVRRAGSDPAAIILAPLRGRERVLGILYIKRRGEAARFEARELDLVRIFAAHASIALQNALTHRAVEIRAQMDSLTGLRNHGTFREELQAIVRKGEPFALLMLDLDDFKSHNDRHGHEAGNVLLKSIGEAIRAASRESDHLYRYGGDEFSLILPRTRGRDAMDVAQRVRAAIHEAPGLDGRPAGMRCCVGVATFPEDGSDRASLLLAADRALYAAKRAGRDRIATAAEGLALAREFVPPSMPVDEVGVSARSLG